MSDFTIHTSKFFWDFKRMDNAEYNFIIVENLIQASLSYDSTEEDQQRYFFKPIIIIMTSIIECTIYDFLLKIQLHHYEKIPNLSQKDIDSIKNIDIPHKLASFNEICKKYEFLRTMNANIYIESISKIQKEIVHETKLIYGLHP